MRWTEGAGTSKNERVTEGRRVSALARVLVALAAGILALGVASALTRWQVATLIGWDITAIVFIAWVWLSVGYLDGPTTAEVAAMEDDSRPAADFLLIAASAASLPGVGLALVEAAGESGATEALIITVATTSVVLAWSVVHTVFTLRYASLYYRADGGIDFNEQRQPDYGDFAYLAFTIGMTYQVSDTALTSKAVRATALRHALLSFMFGTGVVAVVINVVAGLLSE
jgi:uncharacterized membrane protein